ncbi:low affinity iron permease family protein [Pedobacter gandavensis]|uniref:low affinity iron permease family protein n=1 Tax=Pedobacter gandavensis TaxID=2679963 RepID=UPI00292EE593|nr:low affinity iron permease family protein [Pedobacter gandavensis]
MKNNKGNFFEKASTKITNWTGSPVAFCTAFLVVIVWVLSGPIFDYSDTWQLVINTGTTIITFLMVFLIQKSQNKDSKAIQLKLNELIAASRHASNRMVAIEDLTETELDLLHKYYQKLADEAEAELDIHKSHSIDAAVRNHKLKKSHIAAGEKEPEEPQVPKKKLKKSDTTS